MKITISLHVANPDYKKDAIRAMENMARNYKAFTYDSVMQVLILDTQKVDLNDSALQPRDFENGE